MADKKKIVIVAPADANSDVTDAVKLLKGAGYDVDIEEPTPKALLHIVLGLMGPNAYGFGPGYAYQPGAGVIDDSTSDADDVEANADDTEADDTDVDTGGDDFNFESLGMVNVDGELIEAVTHNSDVSLLCVEGLNIGSKTVYSLNESRFTFFPADVAKLASRVDITVDKHRTSIEIPVQESQGKATLKVGKDLRDMFSNK
ncbi:hypothetical protein [Acinetobacter sp.]|uniref:hypothetical protein n=1 Tax=Acinetobacter sp. TaxID=472 RepID=UPI00388DF72F